MCSTPEEIPVRGEFGHPEAGSTGRVMHPPGPTGKRPGPLDRWWIYQRERFPLLAHGPLIAAFSASAVSFSALLRGPGAAPPGPANYLVAFGVSLASFFLLRIADEFKDAGEDAKYRPYRPVPRGLVTLGELGWVGFAVALAQLALTLSLGASGSGIRWQLPGLLWVTWVYFAGMSREFFARDWLKKRPVVYLFSHMMIMPLIDWFATGCDWVPRGGTMPKGLFWFLAASFCNGVVIELGRKIRAPEQEEFGVQTYTALWGRPVALGFWLGALAATWGCAVLAAGRIGFAPAVGGLLGVLLAGALGITLQFLRCPSESGARRIEAYSGLWTLILYLGLGVVPLGLRMLTLRP